MKDEYSVDYSIPENEVSFLKGMIREYYQPEIERLNNIIETFEEELERVSNMKGKEIERLNNIIKEVREYIEKHIAMFKNGDMLVDMNIEKLLELIDKKNINEEKE